MPKFLPRAYTLPNRIETELSQIAYDNQADFSRVKAVYRRGAASYSALPRPSVTRHEYALTRVSAFCTLLSHPAQANPNYTQDFDLLPLNHALTASANPTDDLPDLVVSLQDLEDYRSPEHAIFSLAEYSGLGYDIIPALRASWVRGVNAHEAPFDRARNLAAKLYKSPDADLLPKGNHA